MKIPPSSVISPQDQGVRFSRSASPASAFTLVEALVCLAIVSVLGVIGGSVYKGVSEKAAMAREFNAAKTLIAAHAAYALDNNGAYIPATDATAKTIVFPEGVTIFGSKQVGSTIAPRYPYRLAPYFNYQIEGVITLNGVTDRAKNAATESFAGAGQAAGSIGNDPLYLSSLYPALGINTLVGGKRRENGEIVNQGDVVSRTSQASKVLVFASAGDGVDELYVNGYMTVNPPNNETVDWGARASQWNSDSNPIDFGHVDFRYSGKAVCAFLDGSVKLQSPSELSDMQLWCRNAAEEANPDYLLQPSEGNAETPPPRPRR